MRSPLTAAGSPFAAGKIDDPAVLRDLKRLLRFVLSPHLGDRPLASRAWFSGTVDPGDGEAQGREKGREGV